MNGGELLQLTVRVTQGKLKGSRKLRQGSSVAIVSYGFLESCRQYEANSVLLIYIASFRFSEFFFVNLSHHLVSVSSV
jgi:hypothetical protein